MEGKRNRYCARYPSPLGEIFLSAADEGLTELAFPTQRRGREEAPLSASAHPVLRQTAAWLDCYFAGGHPAPQQLPLAPQGSAFRREVWALLCQIPYGQTVTYGDLAHELALRRGTPKMAAQAVGGAVGANPIALIIPCHRVIGAGGNLTGYGGGLALKIALLRHEGVDMTALHCPKEQ